MPGMMDTILNLGLNDKTVLGVIEKSKNARFGWDSYRRFIQMFSDVVLKVDKELFEDKLEDLKRKKNVKHDVDLDHNSLKSLVQDYKKIVKSKTGKTSLKIQKTSYSVRSMPFFFHGTMIVQFFIGNNMTFLQKLVLL